MIKNKILMILIAVFFASTSSAEVLLKDNTEILGSWSLYAEAAKLEGEKKSWMFSGILKKMASCKQKPSIHLAEPSHLKSR